MSGRAVAWFWITALAVQGQSISPASTFSGFVHDPEARTLRPVYGVPGSAYAGPAVLRNVDSVWTSGNGAAIAVRDGETAVVTALESSLPSERVIGGLLIPRTTVWSPLGTVAALYSTQQHAVQLVHVNPEISVASPVSLGFAGPVTALAVDEKGDVAVAAGSSVYLLHGSEVRQLASGIDALALAFGAGDVLYAGHSNGITEFRTAESNPSGGRHISEGTSVTALAVQLRTGRLFAMEAAARRIVIYDRAGATLGDVALERTPSKLEVLRAGSLLLLNGIDAPGSPAIVLDIANDPAVFFVPAGEDNPA